MQRTLFEGLPTCYKIENDAAQLIVPTEIGPRILCYGLKDGPNMLGLHMEMEEEHENGLWKPYGGHRLWAAPEGDPRSYTPENDPVEFAMESDFSITLRPALDKPAGIQKEMRVRMDSRTPKVSVYHKLINRNLWPIQAAPWALTIMAPGGVGIIPQEPFMSHEDALLPARAMVLWHYTNLGDPRWTLGHKFVRLKCDPALDTPQKMGFANKQGWAAYHYQNCLMIKTYQHRSGDFYPDYGSSTEVFAAGSFFELETLAPISWLQPGESAEHIEHWYLFSGIELPEDDEDLAKVLEEPLRVVLG